MSVSSDLIWILVYLLFSAIGILILWYAYIPWLNASTPKFVFNLMKSKNALIMFLGWCSYILLGLILLIPGCMIALMSLLVGARPSKKVSTEEYIKKKVKAQTKQPQATGMTKMTTRLGLKQRAAAKEWFLQNHPDKNLRDVVFEIEERDKKTFAVFTLKGGKTIEYDVSHIKDN